MSFNQLVQDSEKVLNYEGAEAFKLTPEMELYTAVVTTSLSDKFYETSKDRIDRIAELIKLCDHHFVAQLAIYARTKMYLRSVPLLLVVELAKIHNGDNLISRTIEKVIQRSDEIMELLVCYQWRNPSSGIKKLGKLSHQIQVGLQFAFNKFDEYQFAKYNRDNLEVKLRDALFIAHPKAKDEEQQKIFDKIVNKNLQIPYTWETELSALGQMHYDSPEERTLAFARKWEELIESQKLGYMAILRNLRNMLDYNVDERIMNLVSDKIENPTEVHRAKQFPFRYLSAYKELASHKSHLTAKLLTSLDKAVYSTVDDITFFDKNDAVFIANDMSGSMTSYISNNSKIMYYEIALLLAMLLQSKCSKVVSGIFADDWKVASLPQVSVLSNTVALGKRIGEVGYGTCGNLPLEWLLNENIICNKVMFFTDCEFWGENDFGRYFTGIWNKYKQIAPDAKLYLFNLAGYGHSPIRLVRPDVFCIAGWSDRIFEMLSAIDNGNSIIEEIKNMDV